MIAYFLAAYLILNGIVFLVYGVDKYKAVHNKWRIPETTLLVIAVIGVIGAFAGMHVFHHKTRKPKFYVGVPVIFFLEVLAVIGVFCAGGKYMGNTAKKENAAKTASLSSTSREGLKRGEEFIIEKQEFKKSLSQESFSIPFNTMDECYRVGDLFVSFDSGTKSKIKIYFWNPKTMKVPAVYTYRENVENYDDSLFAANESGQYVIAQIAEKLIVFNFLGKAMKEISIEEGRPTDIMEMEGKQYILTSSTLYAGSIQSGFRKVGSNSDKEEKKNAEEDRWSLEFLFSCGDYVYVSMTVPAKYHSFSWLWQISLKMASGKKSWTKCPAFLLIRIQKKWQRELKLAKKLLRYCIINSMKMERMKRKNQGDSGSCGKWSYLHRIEKRISRYFGERQQKNGVKACRAVL